MTDEKAIVTALMVMFPALASSLESDRDPTDGDAALDVETLPRSPQPDISEPD